MPATTNQQVGLVFGIIYLLVGLAGFAVTGFDQFASTNTQETLLGFELNPLHNIVHLGIGLALVLSARASVDASRTMNTTIGGIYLLVGVIGLFLVDSEANILSLNMADNFLHLGTGAILLAVGLRRETARA